MRPTPSVNSMIRTLRAERLLAGLNGKELTKKIGVANNSIYKWELGKHDPKLGNFIAWANVLGYSVELVPRLTSHATVIESLEPISAECQP